ncbi:MAG: hypothetical protein AAF384_01855 [Pseudomonadota bacterium]
MTIASLLFESQVLLALAALVVAGVGELALEETAAKITNRSNAMALLWDKFWAPLLRSSILLGFVILLYPLLFGVQVAPDFRLLIAENALRLSNLMGLLLLLSLFLPLAPFFARRQHYILPLQGILATAFVFSWLTNYLGVTASGPWPGIDPAIAIGVLIFVGHRAANRLAAWAGPMLDEALGVSGSTRITLNIGELLAQAPVILLYGFALGRQIAP